VNKKMEKLPELGYSYDALEPYIDEETMRLHHTKHHQKYIDKYNEAIKGTEFSDMPAEEFLKNRNNIPDDIKQAVIDHGGGHVNHSLFWTLLKKDVAMPEKLKNILKGNFGGVDKFKEEFTNAALTQFGSGWAWLVFSSNKLRIMKTPNQNTPLSEGYIPLLAIDVWEHAYYLKYQNKRAEYVENFFKVVNWDEVLRRLED
jgi:superoxide dismutase, Fe-Mn family